MICDKCNIIMIPECTDQGGTLFKCPKCGHSKSIGDYKPGEKCCINGEEYQIIDPPFTENNETKIKVAPLNGGIIITCNIKDVILIGQPKNIIDDVNKFGTGAVRSKDVDEFRFDLISPYGIMALSRAYKEGADKYPAWNCEQGFPASDLINHMEHHLLKYKMGDRNEPHMGKIMWGACQIEHNEVMHPELNSLTLRKEGCLPPDNPDNLLWKDIYVKLKSKGEVK
jgi:hypothetical protein